MDICGFSFNVDDHEIIVLFDNFKLASCMFTKETLSVENHL